MAQPPQDAAELLIRAFILYEANSNAGASARHRRSSTTKLCMTTLSSRPAPTCRSPTTRRHRRRSQSAVVCNSSPFQWILALKSRIDGARRGLQRVKARAKIQISPICRFSRWVAHNLFHSLASVARLANSKVCSCELGQESRAALR